MYQSIESKLSDAVEAAGGTIDMSKADAIRREAAEQLAPTEFARAQAIADAWWGKPVDCWQTIELAASLGYTLPSDCAFSEWMRTQKKDQRR